LYIYRSNAQGASVEMTLLVGGRHVATSAGKMYIKLEVTPGRHRIVSRVDNSDKRILQDIKVGQVDNRTKLILIK